jgi:hypothetical protein
MGELKICKAPRSSGNSVSFLSAGQFDEKLASHGFGSGPNANSYRSHGDLSHSASKRVVYWAATFEADSGAACFR